MTLAVNINPGPAEVWLVFGVIVLLVGYFAYQAGRNLEYRHWYKDQSRKNAAAWQANFGMAMGDPVVISRVDAEQTVYKRRMWREDGFSWQEAA